MSSHLTLEREKLIERTIAAFRGDISQRVLCRMFPDMTRRQVESAVRSIGAHLPHEAARMARVRQIVAVRMFRDGKSHGDIGRFLGISPSSVGNALCGDVSAAERRLRSKAPRRKLNDEQRADVVARVAAASERDRPALYAELAKQYGVCRNSIKSVVRRSKAVPAAMSIKQCVLLAEQILHFPPDEHAEVMADLADDYGVPVSHIRDAFRRANAILAQKGS